MRHGARQLGGRCCCTWTAGNSWLWDLAQHAQKLGGHQILLMQERRPAMPRLRPTRSCVSALHTLICRPHPCQWHPGCC